MAVPKRKTSPSKRGKRRSHDFLDQVFISQNKKTGELHRRHHIDANGMYRGKKIINTSKE